MLRRLRVLPILIMGLIAATGAVTYTQDSNTLRIVWSLSCNGQPVCVSFNGLSGNSTLVNYSVKVLASRAFTNQYLNTTASGPPNVSYSLNGTTGTHWLYGPYSYSPNIYYPYSFQLKYNGTAGTYNFTVNIVQAA